MKLGGGENLCIRRHNDAVVLLLLLLLLLRYTLRGLGVTYVRSTKALVKVFVQKAFLRFAKCERPVQKIVMTDT